MPVELSPLAEQMSSAEGIQSDPAPSTKPAVLIIGGLGYIGRFLALYIHNNSLASEVRLVDKQLPELAWLSPEMLEACSRDKFMQADAAREQSLSRIFTPASDPTKQYDYVFNCGGETRYSQDDAVYRLRSHALSLTIGRECARRRVAVYVELSTGHVYKPSRTPCKESDKLKPWHRLAKWKLQAEHDLAKVERLDAVVLRLANVYGPYAPRFLATAICMARVYQSEGKEMRWLWDRDLRVNTVHVEDVARACWRAAEWYVEEKTRRRSVKGKAENLRPEQQEVAPIRPLPIFNIVDHGDTSQANLSLLLTHHFKITHSFAGTLASSFARLHLDSVVDDVNDETLDPWAALIASASSVPVPTAVEGEGESKANNGAITNGRLPQSTNTATATTTTPTTVVVEGPISPFMEREALLDRELSMDGSLFEKTTGFHYTRESVDGTRSSANVNGENPGEAGAGLVAKPKPAKIDAVAEAVESYKRMGWWP